MLSLYGIEYLKSIVHAQHKIVHTFFSNIGAEGIVNRTLIHAREQIKLKEREQIIEKSASNAGKSEYMLRL